MIDLEAYSAELQHEFKSILHYWMRYAADPVHGGFYGSIDNYNNVNTEAPKGLVLHARILWTFSAAYNFTTQHEYLAVAENAFHFLRNFFSDPAYGGAYWTVEPGGRPLNDRKQVYGLAFYLYALAEYQRATQQQAVLATAIDLFRLIEAKSFDTRRKGYFEAFARDWQPLSDLRLSPKDANEQKTMNTHLHIIEAYANLYKQWPDDLLRQRIVQLLEVFDEYMIDKESGHLLLFFDEDWQYRPDVISYGHDIEAAWLLQQCATITGDAYWTDKMKEHALRITRAAIEGLDTDGGLWYEYNPASKTLVKEKHWWPQAEAMLGFFNAWEISGNEWYLQASLNSWNFIQQYIRDNKQGEWFWGVQADYTVMQGYDKAGFWKCPYHNSRACMEIIHRIQHS